MKWRLHGCQTCGGDLYQPWDDPDLFVCWMCARSYPAVTPTERAAAIREALPPDPAEQRCAGRCGLVKPVKAFALVNHHQPDGARKDTCTDCLRRYANRTRAGTRAGTQAGSRAPYVRREGVA